MIIRTTHDVATVVRARRHDLCLTQQRLADLAGVGRSWVVELEAGHPRAEMAKVLSVLGALRLSVDVSPVDDDNVMNLDTTSYRHAPRARQT